MKEGGFFHALQRSLPTALRFRMGRGCFTGGYVPSGLHPRLWSERTSGAPYLMLLSYPFEMTFCSPRAFRTVWVYRLKAKQYCQILPGCFGDYKKTTFTCSPFFAYSCSISFFHSCLCWMAFLREANTSSLVFVFLIVISFLVQYLPQSYAFPDD